MKLYFQEKSGFTLVEIILVTALIAITSTISLKIAARQVAADMQLARLRAVSTNKRYRVEFDVINNQYDLVKCNDNNCTSTIVEKDNQGLPHSIVLGYKSGAKGSPANPTTVIADSVTFSGDKASFSPGGTAGQGTIYIKNDNDDTVAVTISESSTSLIRLYHLQPSTNNIWDKIS
jgi:prepilin-type N-terminal cleavage/methylation domain-containing protein